MNRFVHGRMHHFMAENDGDGNDLGGAEQEEEQAQEEENEEEQEESEEDGEDDVVVTIAGEKPAEEQEEQAAAPTWVKDLRKQHREAQKTIRELQAQLKKPEQAAVSAPVLGKKPAMEDDDIDWDAEKFEAKLTAWHDRKREIDQHQRQQEESVQKQKTEWEGRLATYNTSKAGLKVKDFEDAEENVTSNFDVTQQGIIIQGADNSALVVYALGKNPKKVAELATIKDPIKFAFAIAKLETQLKVQNKKSAPPPEKTVSGTGRMPGSTDTKLEKLRAEAERTGDQSKVVAYKREQRRKQNG